MVEIVVNNTKPLHRYTVQWAVERYNTFPFPNFGNVTFSDIIAMDANGNAYYPSNAKFADIQWHGLNLTSVTTSGQNVTITRVNTDLLSDFVGKASKL